MKRIIYIWTLAPLLLALASCKEAPFTQTPTNGTPPPPLENIQVESLPGGAKISYDIPPEKDISYVKGEYLFQGKKKVARSSVYNNYLIVEGLGSVEPVEITLYLVDHSENVSTPVTKTFTPGKPPIETIFESLQMRSDFGGVNLWWDNELGIEIGVTLFAENEEGEVAEQNTVYSRLKDGDWSFRGFDVKEQRFAARITDKWGNVSPLKEATLTPLYERLLDKINFKEVALPGDNTSVNNNRPLRNCWDNRLDVIWHTVEGQFTPMPFYFTIDLGVEECQFSRMTLFARSGYYFSNHTFRTFEVWGAKEYKKDMSLGYWTGSDGHDREPGYAGPDWKEDWEKLGDFEIRRPSGATEASGNPGGIDSEYGVGGYGFTVPIGSQPLRYLRFVVKTTWSAGAMHMAEFDFYGDDGKKE